MKNLIGILLLIIFVPNADCWAAGRPKYNVKKGNLLYNKGEFDAALERYEDALAVTPDSPIVNYNTGAALYKTEEYQTAIEHFAKALLSEDKGLEQKAAYNAGNAEYKHGISLEDSDLPSAINLLKQSLRHYERAMVLDAEDEDARHNYEFVKKELERLRKKQEQQQQNKSQQDKQQQNNPQQDKQDKQNKQERQQNQKKSAQQEEQAEQDARPEAGEMSEKEARMLLENYRQDEEPKELYKEKLPVSGVSEPLKDW